MRCNRIEKCWHLPRSLADPLRPSLLLAALAFLPLAMGCTSRSLLRAQEAYRTGDLERAEKSILKFVEKDGDGVDRVIAYLELGNILRANGDFESSNEAFLLADQAVDEVDAGPDVRLSKEGMALLTNMNALPYRGYNYDRVMLSTYRAINYLALGNFDDARVEMYRAYNRQVEAIERNAKRIEKAEEEAKYAAQNRGEKDPGYDVNRAQKDSRFQAGVQKEYGDLQRFSAYADYVNPMTEFLQGIYFMNAGLDANDAERARVSLRRLAGMAPANPYVPQDLALAEQVVRGKDVVPITYVVFENGTGPRRGQIRIDIPLFLLNNSVDYVGANFPRLIMNEDCLRNISAQAGGETYVTYVLADMDSVVGQEFRNELPIVITRTLIAAGLKAAAAYAIRRSVERQNNDMLTLAVRLSATAYQAGANQADLRTWATLPKQFQYARFPTPSDGKVRISGSGQSSIEVEVEPDAFNVIFVRGINATAPLQVYKLAI